MYKFGEDWVFDKEEIKLLIKGKVSIVRCWECNGSGWVWVDGDNGNVVPAIDEEREDDFYQDGCHECDNLGFFINFED